METINELRQEAHHANEKSKEYFYAAIVALSVALIFPISFIFGLISGDLSFIGGDVALSVTLVLSMAFAPLFGSIIAGAIYFRRKNQAKLEEIQELKSQA